MKTIHSIFLTLALVGIALPCSLSSMDRLSIFSILISLGIIIIVCGLVKKPEQPQQESILKKHHGKKLTVEKSLYYGTEPGDNRCATLFSYPGAYGIELIYCYTSCKFETGDIVDVTFQKQEKALQYRGPGVARTSYL